MGITDFGGKSKDEIIEYLIDEHNATERETAQLRQELAEARETIVKGHIRKQEGEKKKKASYEELYDKLPSRDLLCHLDPDAKVCSQCGSIMERVGWEKVPTELVHLLWQEVQEASVRCAG